VTEFEIPKEYFSQFKVENVGGFNHNELWVPSEQLHEFNVQIQDGIKVVGAYYGKDYTGEKKYS